MTTIPWGQLKKTAGDAAKPVPADWYDVTVSQADATMSSTGKPMIKVRLKINGGPHDGRILFDQYVLSAESPFALMIFFGTMAAFGVDPEAVSPDGSLDPVAAALVNRRARVQVEHREFQGRMREDIKQYVEPTGGQVAVGAGIPVPGAVVPGSPVVPATVPVPAASPVPQVTTPQSPVTAAPDLPF